MINNLQHRAEELLHVSESELEVELDRARLADALAELHRLLEEYAPTWYTQKHHEKALAALKAGREL